MLQFAYPWLFLLLPLPFLIHHLVPALREPRHAVRVPFLDLLSRLAGQKASGGAAIFRRLRIQWLHAALVWIALIVAVARPLWMDDPVIREMPMRDLLVAVDLSGSMDTRDFIDSSGESSDRLTAAKQVLGEFLSRREGDRVGLIFFGSAAFVQAPFTEDLEVVAQLMDEAQVRMLGPKTMLGDAIGVAINLFERSEVEDRVLIVLTDGNDTGSLVPPERAAEIARDNGVTIYTIAMGDPQAAGEQALDEEALTAIAATTGGEYFHADNRQELESIYDTLDQLNPKQVEVLSYRPQYEMYHWPLAFGLVLSILFFAVTELRFYGFRRTNKNNDAAENTYTPGAAS
jgi:Ca-activated chloride channel family protein